MLLPSGKLLLQTEGLACGGAQEPETSGSLEQMLLRALHSCALRTALCSVTACTAHSQAADERSAFPPWIQQISPGSHAPRLVEAAGFQEVVLGPAAQSATFTRNSLLLLPLLTEPECDALIAWADQKAAALPEDYDDPYCPPEALRLRVVEMPAAAWVLTQEVLCSRVLSFVEAELPQVAQRLFGRDALMRVRKGELVFSYSGYEPAINRYKAGGDFEPHSDGYSLTVIVPLSKSGAYTGGGTLFWPEGPAGEKEYPGVCQVLIDAPRGTAVLFNGNIRHAGRPVRDGVRHLFVASFDLNDIRDDSEQ